MTKILSLAGVITLLCSTIRNYFCVCILSGSATEVETRFDCTTGIKNYIRAHPSDIRVRKLTYIVYCLQSSDSVLGILEMVPALMSLCSI